MYVCIYIYKCINVHIFVLFHDLSWSSPNGRAEQSRATGSVPREKNPLSQPRAHFFQCQAGKGAAAVATAAGRLCQKQQQQQELQLAGQDGAETQPSHNISATQPPACPGPKLLGFSSLSLSLTPSLPPCLAVCLTPSSTAAVPTALSAFLFPSSSSSSSWWWWWWWRCSWGREGRKEGRKRGVQTRCGMCGFKESFTALACLPACPRPLCPHHGERRSLWHGSLGGAPGSIYMCTIALGIDPGAQRLERASGIVVRCPPSSLGGLARVPEGAPAPVEAPKTASLSLSPCPIPGPSDFIFDSSEDWSHFCVSSCSSRVYDRERSSIAAQSLSRSRSLSPLLILSIAMHMQWMTPQWRCFSF